MSAPAHATLGVDWLPPFLPTAPDEALEAEARRHTGGNVPVVLGYLTPLPWLARTFVSALGIRFSYADPRTISLVGLLSSHENACRHCYGHRRALLRIQGLSASQIERFEHDLELAELSESGRATLSFVRALARSRPRPVRAEAEALRARGVPSDAIAEVVGEVANWCCGNRIATLIAAPPETKLEALPDSFLGMLLRPFVARQVRKGYAHVPPPGALKMDVPFGAALEPLATTHVGHFFRDALEGAFASVVLPRRTKLLMFAVVARALECRICETESRTSLAALGLDVGSIDSALDHLSAPGGDATEEKLLAFARDSVRYRPAEAQERSRALRDEVGHLPLLEAVGITALANGIVRIAMLST